MRQSGRFCFVHAADLHLDTPFEGIGRVAPVEVADVLRDASLEAWDALVRVTIERDAAFLLLAGDVYDGAERGVRAQLRFFRGVQQLADRGIQTFIVHGNHDPVDGWSAIRAWPAAVTVFGSREVESVAVERGGARIATIHGISYPRRDVVENLAVRFSRSLEPGLQVALLHCNVGGNPEHALYSPCSVDDLRRTGIDYWALGHVHRLQLVSDAKPLIVYSGCLQGRSWGACEQGPKGAVIIDFDDAGVQSLDFVPLDRVRFVSFEIDVMELADLPALHRVLTDRLADIRAANASSGLVLRAILVGRSELHRDLSRSGATDDLLKVLRQESADARPFAWWDRVVDHTAPFIDLETIRQRGDFSAELVGFSEDLKTRPARIADMSSEQIESLRKAGISRTILADAMDTDDAALLHDAVLRAIGVLDDARGGGK